MVPLIVLVIGWLVLCGLGLAGVEILDGWQPALRGALAMMFALTATAHFGARRGELVAMVPPQLPAPGILVTMTGVLEAAGAIGLLFDATAPFAAAGLGLLLLAMFPANVHAARAHLTLGKRPATPLIPRTLMQATFLGAVALLLV